MSQHHPNDLFHNRYKLIKLVGSGGMSEVWEVRDIYLRDRIVAIKIYSYEGNFNQQVKDAFLEEFLLMSEFNHPNLLHPEHFEIEPSIKSPYLVMKLYSRGSAASIINETGTAIDEKMIAQFIKDAAAALNTLHNHNVQIIHQDIKPDNFLIDDNGSFVLTDFGVSTRKRETRIIDMNHSQQMISGDTPYVAPERFQGAYAKPAQDIFSLGVTLFEILTGVLPFQEFGGGLLNKGYQVPELNAEFGYSNRLNLICKHCLQLLPEARPTAKQLVEYADYFQQNGFWPPIPSLDLNNIEAKSIYKKSIRIFEKLTNKHINELESSEIDHCIANFNGIIKLTNDFPDSKQVLLKLESLKRDKTLLSKIESDYALVNDEITSAAVLESMLQEYKSMSIDLTPGFYKQRVKSLENKIVAANQRDSKREIINGFLQKPINQLNIQEAEVFFSENKNTTAWGKELEKLKIQIVKAQKYQQLIKDYEALKDTPENELKDEKLKQLLNGFSEIDDKSGATILKEIRKKIKKESEINFIPGKRLTLKRVIMATVILGGLLFSIIILLPKKRSPNNSDTGLIIKDTVLPKVETDSISKAVGKKEASTVKPIKIKPPVEKVKKDDGLKPLTFEPTTN